MITIIIIIVDSRDKETMMESMMKLPDDMFRQELLPYLTVHDIVNLDNACMNHKYRTQLMEKINGVILIGDKVKPTKASLFKWLGIRRIYLIKINIFIKDYRFFSSSIKNDYVDQFRYTQHVEMRGAIRDDITMFIIPHCPCLLSLDMSTISTHCTKLHSIKLEHCDQITDTSIISISSFCTGLKSLNLRGCNKITDASII
jgi:hypothetical protein